MPVAWPASIGIEGAKGVVTPEVLVRVTNLDDENQTVVTNSSADGSFALKVTVSPDDELRLEAVSPSSGLRSPPVDLVFAAGTLRPSERFSCLGVEPGLELSFARAGAQSLTLSNGCATPITVQSASSRRSLPDFALATALPLASAAGESTTLSVAFSPSSAENQEDVLFLMLDDGTTTLRYPITVYRSAQ